MKIRVWLTHTQMSALLWVYANRSINHPHLTNHTWGTLVRRRLIQLAYDGKGTAHLTWRGEELVARELAAKN